LSGTPSSRCRRMRRSRLIGVRRASGWLCMGGEVLGRAVTPRPWRPHTQSSAEQPGGTTHLCRRRTGGGDLGGLSVRQGRCDSRASGGSRPLPQELDRCPEGRQPGDLLGRQPGPEGGGLPAGLAAAMIHGQDHAR
jgi:hypothetical protein